jgi:mercuric reductase
MLGNFGSRVTFISRRTLAPTYEPEISQTIAEVLTDAGHTVLEHANTERVEVEDGEKVLRGHLSDGSPFEARVDEILVATGRTPNTEALGLDRLGIDTDDRGAIVVDEHQRTSVPSIYAAGDVTDQPNYVYVVAAAGAAAAQNALEADADERLRFTHLPRVIFTGPQIAQAGLTEHEARERGFEVETAVLPLDAIPRALVNGDTRGLFKLVAERGTRRLLGVSIIADGAAEVIQAAVLAIQRRMKVEALGATWAPYLTMAEGLKLAALAFDRDVSMLSCCAA